MQEKPLELAAMKVVLLRHASRPAHDPGDCALTSYGLVQANALAAAIKPQGDLPIPTRLLSSPKKRAQQTLSPLASAAQVRLEIEHRLDERRPNESARDFDLRIKELIEEISRAATTQAGCYYLCSHFDWLQSAALLVPSDASPMELERGWANCEFLVFRIEDELWRLVHSGIVAPR